MSGVNPHRVSVDELSGHLERRGRVSLARATCPCLRAAPIVHQEDGKAGPQGEGAGPGALDLEEERVVRVPVPPKAPHLL